MQFSLRRQSLLVLFGLTAVLVGAPPHTARAQWDGTQTATPIKHLVVIFQENISFDHYFGTYPVATNPANEPAFHAQPGTPTVNGYNLALLTQNANAMNPTNGTGAVNPFRLDRSQALTADQDHGYTAEQSAFHNGLMDLFPHSVGVAGPPPSGSPAAVATSGLTMGYFDGNTVTAMWNYAQRFAMSDNSYGTGFGPSTPGALNLASGQTNGVSDYLRGTGALISDGSGGYTDIGDSDPIGDVCSTTTGENIQMGGRNIGDLLNDAGISWGWFEGGFNLSLTNSNGTTGCGRKTTSPFTGVTESDYIPHHNPFQYYVTTANPTHARPSSVDSIGKQGDAGNHEYDINDFYAAVEAGNFPAVSFLKAPGIDDGHAGYSSPLDEQAFITQVINFLQSRPEWSSTAVIINYDDSDGWYDHQMSPLLNQSSTTADTVTGTGSCGNGASALPGSEGAEHAQGRCGFGPRLPMMVISPWSRVNYVDHTLTCQTSIIQFVEDNWLSGERLGGGSFDALAGSLMGMFDFKQPPRLQPLILSGTTGEPTGPSYNGPAWGRH